MIRASKSSDITYEKNLTVTSPAFEEGGTIPVRYTGDGEDVSPALTLSELSPNAKSIALVMDDLDFPLRTYNHWVIWNLPVQEAIPEAIEHGERVESLDGAVQGIGYGRHKYRGPKPPFGTHQYVYRVFVLDTTLDLSANAGKKDLLKAMEGHVLQYGDLTGQYR